MSIQTKPEPKELSKNGQLETCIFCGKETIFWARPEINRPVCNLCAMVNNESDIPKAKFNY